MEKANIRVSSRSRKLVEMCHGQDVDDSDLSGQTDPFATDSDDEYIPSTDHSSSDGGEDTKRKKSPIIHILSNIVIPK
ncbi:unnamed protein product, partial [Callosobruchus maculatus]